MLGFGAESMSACIDRIQEEHSAFKTYTLNIIGA